MDTLPSPNLPAPNQAWTGVFEAEQPRVDFFGLLARRKWLVLMGLVIGLAVAYLYFTQAQEWYQSSAKIRIRPRNQAQVSLVNNDTLLPGADAFKKRHDKDIASERIIRRCFEESAELAKMSIFDGLTEEERIGKVLDKLDVRPDKEDGEVFDLTFKATNATEARTMLNSIVATYEKDLELQFSSESDRVVTTFKGIKSYLSDYIANRQKTRDEIYQFARKNNVSDIVVDNNNLSVHNRKVGELHTQIDAVRRKRAEARAEILWILQSLKSQRVANAKASKSESSEPSSETTSTAAVLPPPASEDTIKVASEPTEPQTGSSDVAQDSATPDPTGESQDSALTTPEPNQDSTIVANGAKPQDQADVLAPDETATPPSAIILPDSNEQMRMAVNFIQQETTGPDPVSGWISEIFEELKTPNNAASNIVLTLAVTRQIDRPIEINKGFVTPETTKNTTIIDLANKIDELKTKRELKILELGRRHPEIQTIDANIALFERRKTELETQELPTTEIDTRKPYTDEQFLAAYVNSLAFNYSELNSQIPELIREFNVHYQRAEMLSEISRQLKDADEETKMFREFLQQTVATLAQINPRYIESGFVDAEKEGFIFVALDTPSMGSRVWPDLPIILGLGGLIGSLFGLCLGYFVDMADKTFHNPDEIMKQLSMPLIGHIPVIQQSKRHVIENSFIDPSICTYHRPKSQASEAFRAIRTALFFSTKGKTNSIIQVTSPTPGDGKSTIAANVAVSIAQSGKRVLLLDADMRRPTVHHAFGIKTKEGFPQVLNGDKSWRSAVYNCEEIPGLSLLPCGDKPTNPAELISTPRVGELLEEMRHHFDFIVIDSPPVLAVTDPCPVAARVDGVILTIRIKKNVKISSDRATEILHSVGANLIGVVVNGVGNQSGYGSQYSYGAYRAGYQYNGYGYGYGYSYGYGRHTDDEKPMRPTPVQNLVAPTKKDVEVS